MRRATKNDRQTVIDILTQAFEDNRSVNYVVKQDQRRFQRIQRLMEYSFNVCQNFGEVWLDDNDQACALILFPDKKTTSIKTILWDIKLAFSAIGVARVPQVLKREKSIKAFHPNAPICYLWFVGVAKNAQGKGIGSNLIMTILSQRVKERPVYLETSAERNLPFYKKLGFEIFHSLNLSYKLYLLRKMN